MRSAGRRRTRLTHRTITVGAALLMVTSALTAGAPAAAAQEATPEVQEVRTVWTSEFGVPRPTGLAYVPSQQEFLVAGDAPAGTEILRLGPDEDPQGSFRLPELDNQQTLAFDAAQQELTAIAGDERIDVPARELTADRPTSRRTSIDGLGLDSSSSTAFDPQSGTWYVLEPDSDTVAVVVDDDVSSAPERLEVPAGEASVIAFNPEDDLLYVMDATASTVQGLDGDGAVRTTFDLSSTALTDPVAMTFAPSTDPTDDPGEQNLFVADAGDDTTLGGVTELSFAAVAVLAATIDPATLVQTIATSAWSPASPDPAGITWLPSADELAVVDSEVDEPTGAGWHNVNFWRAKRTGSVAGTGALWGPNSAGSYSREPTGLGYDAQGDRLFISDDSADRVFVVRRGNDGVLATTDDVVSSINTSALGAVDTEDPEFDPVSGHLFFLDGVGMEIYRVNPVDGVFGNGNDTVTHFDISHLGPTDFEGLASNPERGTLYVGARATKDIFEITHDGTLVRTIDAGGISGLRFISGLATAPASNNTGMNLWIVDRAIDNGADPNENDGKIFEITAPDIGGPPADLPPVAVDDAAATPVDTPVTVPVLANDSDPNGDPLTVTNLTQPANGTAQRNPNNTVTYTPTAGFTGSDTFTYTANDGQANSNVATVTVTVFNASGGGGAPAFRSAASAIVTGASGTTLTIARPNGVQAGDLLLAQIRHRSLSTLTPPTGWTEITTIAQSTAHHGVYYKIASGSEPASYQYNQNADAGRMAGGIGAYIGVDPTTPINAWAASGLDTATLVAPTANATVPDTRVVRLWGWRGPSATDPGVGFNAPPSGLTQRWSEQVGHSNNDRNRVLAADRVQAAPGAVGTATASGSTSSLENRRNAVTVVLTPATGGEPPTNAAPVVDAVRIDQTSPGTNDTLTVTVDASDADGDPLTYSYQWTRNGQNINGATSATLNLSDTGNGDKGDAIAVRVTASDGTASSAPVTSPTATVVDSPPTFNQDLGDRTSQEGATVSLSAAAADPDGDPLTYEATGLPSGLTINASTGQINGTVATGASADSPYAVTITVRDGTAVDATDTFTWTITADTAPGAPTGLGATVTSTGINLDWNDSPEPDLAGYVVYRSTAEAGPYQRLTASPISGSAYQDLTAPRGTSHYRVAAVDAGDLESAPATTSAARRILFRAATSAAARNVTSFSLSRPAGVAGGDVMLAAVSLSETVTVTPPTGWTQVRVETNGSTMRQAIYRKVATSGEPSSYPWGLSARTTSVAGAILAYEGVDTLSSVDVSNGASSSTSGAITAPSVSTTVQDTLLIGFFGIENNPSITAPNGMIKQAEIMQNSGRDKLALTAADEVLPAVGASGPRSATVNKNGSAIGQLVALRPMSP
jgi:hypothetical protein